VSEYQIGLITNGGRRRGRNQPHEEGITGRGLDRIGRVLVRVQIGRGIVSSEEDWTYPVALLGTNPCSSSA